MFPLPDVRFLSGLLSRFMVVAAVNHQQSKHGQIAMKVFDFIDRLGKERRQPPCCDNLYMVKILLRANTGKQSLYH